MIRNTVFVPAEDYGRSVGCCRLCGAALYIGQSAWRFQGTTVCEGCFTAFARELLAPYEFQAGEEAKNEFI